MMVEGTVQIDNSAFVEKYLANARRAKQKEDWEEVEKYYNLVEQNDPTNIEAIFYSSYGKARLSMVENDIFKRQQICEVFCNSISVIDDNYDVEKSEENQKVILQMHQDLFRMYGTSFVYTKKPTVMVQQVITDMRPIIYLPIWPYRLLKAFRILSRSMTSLFIGKLYMSIKNTWLATRE